MAAHARPGKSFTEMLDLILRNQRRPNDPFSPQLLMAIFWEEGLFTNKKQQKGTAVGFGQVEPAELWKLTTAKAREHGYDVPGVSTSTRSLSDDLAVTVPSCLLLHQFHASQAPTTEGKVRSALNAYGGVDYKGPSSLTREDRLRIIANWRKCEEKLKALPFSEYAIANYSGNLDELANKYMDALALSRPFNRDFVFSRTPELVRFRDLLFPRGWSLYGVGPRPGAAAAAQPRSPAAAATPARAESLFGEIVESREISFGNGRRFHVVAGPGESLAELEAGDLLVHAHNGSGLRAVPITSTPAAPEDFFFEGVMAEKGPPGLYVEVESAGGYPIARRIADPFGHVAENAAVIRPFSFEDWPGEDLDEGPAEATDAELRQRRTDLVASITKSDLYWHEVPLAEGYRIQVCCPVLKDDVFVPVTGRETMELARKFDVFPLSRAVMDQAHNAALKVEKQQTPASLYDFVTYSNRLKWTPYYTHFGYALSSGAHKLWVISSRGKVINYGFYIRRKQTDPVRCGKYLDPKLNVIQGLGARHDASHWDYSQLLQFMTGLKDASGQAVDLRRALLDRHPAVWDEAQPPAAGSVP